MLVEAIRTHRVQKNESIFDVLNQYIKNIKENTIVAITSKLVSVCQGCMIDTNTFNKETLVYQQADAVAQIENPTHGAYLTIKHNRLIPSAGIDESNAQGTYIVYPPDMPQTVISIWQHLRQNHKVQNLGVLLTDSSTLPLRRGVVGVGLSWCGFEPLYDYVGKPDIDGRPLQITAINLLDAMAATAVWAMGEGNEQTPLAVIQSPPFVRFVDRPPLPEEAAKICIALEEDLYSPLLKGVKWHNQSN